MQLDTRLPLLAAQQPALQFQPETRLESLGKIAPAINAMRQLQAQQIDMENELRKRQAFDQFRAAAQQAGLSGDLGQLAQVFFTHGQSPEHFKFGTELMKAAQEDARNRRLFGYPSEQAALMAAPAGAPSMERKFEQAPVAEAASAMPAARPASVYRYGNRTFTQAQLDEMLGHKDTRSVAEAIIKANEPTALERELQVFGQPTTLAGLSALEAAKRAPVQETTAYREYQKAKDEGFKGTFLDYQERLRKAGATNVSVGPQEKAFETALGSGQAKKLLEDKAVADDAKEIISTVQQGRQLLQSGMITGFGAEFLTQVGAALNQAGINFAEDRVANTQAFTANMAQNVAKLIKQFGAGTGLSNDDRIYATQMAGGNTTLDRKAIEKILDINERAARNVIKLHNERVKDIKTNIPLTVEMPAAQAPRAPAGASAPPAGGTFPQPTQAAIDALKRGQGTDAQFNAIFGPGAAARARGR